MKSAMGFCGSIGLPILISGREPAKRLAMLAKLSEWLHEKATGHVVHLSVGKF